MNRIAVIGAGIIGMSTAVRIQQEVPGCHITVIADRLSPNTTSDCAAGICMPHAVGNTKTDKVRKWCSETFQYMGEMYNKPNAPELGVSMTSGFIALSDNSDEELAIYSDIYLSYQELDENARAALFRDFKKVIKVTTFLTEPVKHLPYLMKIFELNGGEFYQSKIQDLSELYNYYDIIVNTTGTSANKLVNDKEVHPIRGQAYRVKAPWVKHFIIDPSKDSYIIPGIDSVVVGGTHQNDNWSKNVNRDDSEIIWKNAQKLLPSLKKSKVLKQVVGLRPGRPEVRLEREYVEYAGGKITVIHNYGHGGSGVTLFWGCAGEAARLVKDAVENKKKDVKSKL